MTHCAAALQKGLCTIFLLWCANCASASPETSKVRIVNFFREAVDLQRQSRFAESAPLFERVVDGIAAMPSSDTNEIRASLLASALFNLATAETALGQTIRAQRNLKRAILAAKTHTNPGQTDNSNADVLVPALRALGILQLTSGDYWGAQQSFEGVMGRQPWDQSTGFNLYSALKEQGKTAEALKMLEFVVQYDPAYELGVVELAEHYMAGSAGAGLLKAGHSSSLADSGNTPPGSDFQSSPLQTMERMRSLLLKTIAANTDLQLHQHDRTPAAAQESDLPVALQARMAYTQLLIELEDPAGAADSAQALLDLRINGQFVSANDPGVHGQLCVARRLLHDIRGAVTACARAISLVSEKGELSARHRHQLLRFGKAHQKMQELSGYWVQQCYALALLPEAEVLEGAQNGFSFDTITKNDISDAITACQKAHSLTRSVHRNATTLFERTSSADMRGGTRLGEPLQKDWQRNVNALLMVQSSLAILHARSNDEAQAQHFKHLVCDVDRQVLTRTVSSAPRPLRGVNIVVSAGGAGSTSLMWALQSAGVFINAGAGSSYLKHHRSDFAASVASELKVQVERVLYVVRDPRAAVQSIFRRQFQYLLSVQLTGCTSSTKSSAFPRSDTLTSNNTLLSSSAAALQSLNSYIRFLENAQQLQGRCTSRQDECRSEHSQDHRCCSDASSSKTWMDPLPMWDHLKSWTMAPNAFDGSAKKPMQQHDDDAGQASSRVLVVLRERVLEVQVFDKLCSHLGIESSFQKQAFRRSLQEAERPKERGETTPNKYSPQLTNAQEVVLTRHFAPVLEFVRTHLADSGFYEPTSDTIRHAPVSKENNPTKKKKKRKKTRRRSNEKNPSHLAESTTTTTLLDQDSQSQTQPVDISSSHDDDGHDFEYIT